MAFESEIWVIQGCVRLTVLWTDLLESVPGLSREGHRIP
jgi:hypothetical protein